MPNKYTPPADQSIIFLPTDIISAVSYNQNIKAPDKKLEHLVSFLDKNNTNGLNGAYNNAQGLSYQNIANSALSSQQIAYSTDFLPTTSAIATTVGATYTSSVITIPVGRVGLVTKLKSNLVLSGLISGTSDTAVGFQFVFNIVLGFTIRVLECNTISGTYIPIYTKTETNKRVNQILKYKNTDLICSPAAGLNKFIKLELTINTGNPVASLNYDVYPNNGVVFPNSPWSVELGFDTNSTYEIQKSFA